MPVIAPNLSLNASCISGDPFRFVLSIQNIGNSPTGGLITLNHHLPPSIQLISASGPGWTCTPPPTDDVDCTFDGLNTPLGPNDPPLVITIFFKFLGQGLPVITNTATVSTDGDLDVSNNISSRLCSALPPAAAPLLSPGGMAAAGLVLLGVAFVAMRRRQLAD